MRGFGLSVAVMAAILTLSSGVFAEDAQPDATLELTQESVALVLGYTWGSGTLTFQGKSHPVAVDGVSVLALGIVRAKATGEVFNLKRIEDFNAFIGLGEDRATANTVAGRAQDRYVRVIVFRPAD